ncbi:MAG: endo alpha-1,4 polygalactosaminidase [Chloroflexi bacterium]|nr:endo alpha-1,4 polygalactosaminidase [Chloroflexota bacterium]
MLKEMPAGESPGTGAAVWRPAVSTSWQWQLNGPVDLTVQADLFDIDLFDADAGLVRSLHSKGSKVVCYISAGSFEEWRPDAGRFPSEIKGSDLDGWPGERWLDIRRLDVLRTIMESRLDLCKEKGFDGVEFDNVDGYTNETGFPLTYADQLRYNRYLADAAHARGLSAGLKNDLEQVKDLLASFDWAMSEECFQNNECHLLRPFVDAGKAVFVVEYAMSREAFCSKAREMGFNAIRKRLDLDAWREVC